MSGEDDDLFDLAGQDTGSIYDPVASSSSAVSKPYGFYTEDDSQIGAINALHPPNVRLKLERDRQQAASASLPLHEFRDQSTDYPYLRVQYSYDPEDGYFRIEASSHPELRHRGTTEKLHPSSARTIVASGSGPCIGEIASDEMPDLY